MSFAAPWIAPFRIRTLDKLPLTGLYLWPYRSRPERFTLDETAWVFNGGTGRVTPDSDGTVHKFLLEGVGKGLRNFMG